MDLLLPAIVGFLVGNVMSALIRYARHHYETLLPLRRVLHTICSSEAVVVVISTVRGEKYYDIEDREIDYSYAPQEKNVTMVLDALGLSYVAKMLDAIKPRSVVYKTSVERSHEDWEKNLILLGSPLSNAFTKNALAFTNRLTFSDDVTEIMDNGDGGRYGRNKDVDHAIIARITRDTPQGTRTYLILAGLGPVGTAGACHYIATNYRRLAKWLREQENPREFQILLKVNRSAGFTVWGEEKKIPINPQRSNKPIQPTR